MVAQVNESLALEKEHKSSVAVLHSRILYLGDTEYADLVEELQYRLPSECSTKERMSRTISHAIRACHHHHNLSTAAVSLQRKQTDLTCVHHRYDAEFHPAGDLILASTHHPSASVPSLPEEVSQTPRERDSAVLLANAIQRLVHKSLSAVFRDLYCSISISSSRRLGLRQLADFLQRRLRVSSLKEAYCRVAGCSQSGEAPPFLSAMHFIKGLQEVGFRGDGVLIASTLDRDKTGFIKYVDFGAALFELLK